MNVSDNCALCRVQMLRSPVLRLLPCRHLFHVKCSEGVIARPGSLCPICRELLTGHENIVRKIYKKHSNMDRERIVVCANRGEDWVNLAETLNVPYKTAYTWVSSGRSLMLKKGGVKPKALSEDQLDRVIEWLEEDSGLTLKQIQRKVVATFEKIVSIATIGNYLEGRLFTLKQVHLQPITMNSEENKLKRRDYVRRLNEYIQHGKQIVWIDQTNFNLFCRRSRGRAKIGKRAVQILPASKGPNVHLIGGISAAGVVLMERRRGSFTADAANEWIQRLLEQWVTGGNHLNDLVIICDNAPCHARLENSLAGTGVILLRLSPYSPMLNPIETIWSKIKAVVKSVLRNPHVEAPGVGQQRLVHLENLIDDAKETVTGGDCARAAQHTTSFHTAALAMDDMEVGI